MTVEELDNTLKYRKEGLAYVLWRIGYAEAVAIGSSFDKDGKYPRKPSDMFDDLYPPPVSIPMPDSLKKKYYERKGVRM